SPSMNLVDAQIDGGHVSFGGFTIPLPEPLTGRNGPVILGIRPTDFEHDAAADPSLPRLRVRADVVEDLGAEMHVIFPIDAPRVSAEAVRAAADASGEDEMTLLADDQRAVFTAVLDARHPIRPGTDVALALDPTCLYFFESVTGLALDGHARETAHA
ncbi:MAG TPA: hypothetical protein VLN26_08055, partial [Gaiellaceae bacterium]|nr:hypothetical protein [Gaiellaceae bacterium]